MVYMCDIVMEPVIEEFPCIMTAAEGQRVRFKVKASGSPNPGFQWYHDDKIVAADRQHVTESDGSLVISPVEQQHSGVYKLVAENVVGPVERQTKLMVVSNETDQEGGTYAALHMYTAVNKCNKSMDPVSLDEFEDFVIYNHTDSNEGFHILFSVRKVHTHY